MQDSKTREKILKKVRSALISRTENPFPKADHDNGYFSEIGDEPEIIFAEKFTRQGGRFIYCESWNEFAEKLIQLSESNQWKNLVCSDEMLNKSLNTIAIISTTELITGSINIILSKCLNLIARSGGIVIASNQMQVVEEKDVQIFIAEPGQFRKDLKDALHDARFHHGNIPSSIEIIQPENFREIYLFLIDNN